MLNTSQSQQMEGIKVYTQEYGTWNKGTQTALDNNLAGDIILQVFLFFLVNIVGHRWIIFCGVTCLWR